jgi:N-acetylneuraminate synthase
MTEPCIVAELSGNHLGSLDLALEILEAAANAGASAFKLQTYRPDDMVGDPHYVIQSGKWKGQKLLDLYKEAQTFRMWHPIIFKRAKKIGIEVFSTPFSRDDVEFLETLDCPRYKIASHEIIDLELIDACAKTGKPMVISTGMATSLEIAQAHTTAYLAGCRDLTLLKCTSAYPAQPDDMHLRTMRDLMPIAKVGLSDHSEGTAVAVAAVALGATMIEKHLCLDRKLGGPDAAFSLEPNEFKRLVDDCRIAARAVGKHGQYGGGESPELRRGLWASRPIPKGTVINRAHIKVARPGLGLPANRLNDAVGSTAVRDIAQFHPIMAEDIDG